MTSLFGIPMDTVLHVTLGLFLAATAVLAALAIRHRLLFRMGWRNIHRRRAQSMLIVFGLMLATVILTSAFTAGDTMSYTIRSYGASSYGPIDEAVVKQAASDTKEAAPSYRFYPSTEAARIRRALHGNTNVDGVLPAVSMPAPLHDLTSRQSRAAADVLAIPARYPAAFGPLMLVNGKRVSLAQLGPGEVYVNQQAARGLNARPGDRLAFYVNGRQVDARLAGVLRDADLAAGGLMPQRGASDPLTLLPLGRLQTVDGHPGALTHVLISNRGDAISGASRTDAVRAALQRHGVLTGYYLDPVKQRALQEADRVGASFTAGFVAFGLFSMAAGILLIFLLFVMLAAERRVEMGIERAIGTKRRHLVQQFVFEGYVYDLGAALVGVVLGILVGLGLVGVMASLFSAGSNGAIQIQGHVEPRSILVAFSLGALATLLTVVGSAWRVSKLNIVAALRDLPDETEIDSSVSAAFLRPVRDLARSWRRLRRGDILATVRALFAAPWHAITAFRTLVVRGPVLIVGGFALFELGNNARQAFPYDLGLSLCAIGLAMLLRWILGMLGTRESVRNRVGFSLAGLSLVAFWLLPFDFFRSDLYYGPEMFFLYGMMLILGGVWTVMYNVDLLIAACLRLLSVAGGIAPALRMAVAYPLLHRLRTGLTLFMFSLVIFALMVEIALNGSTSTGSLDLNRDAGGFAVYGTTTAQGGIPHLQRQIDANPALRRAGVTGGAIGSVFTYLRQQGNDRNRWHTQRTNVVDDAFLTSTRFTLKGRARGFRSDAAVWRALRTHPGYAIASPDLAAHSAQTFGLRGLPYGGSFSRVHIEMRDPRTGTVMPLTVVGVLDYGSSNVEPTWGMYVSADTLATASDRSASPSTYVFHVPPGQDVHRMALTIGSTFLRYGLDVTETSVQYGQDQSLSQGFYNLLAAFMALGLVVGVAALGVIATRSVVERRQHIGVLRAIGFRKRTVHLAFLLEATFIALGGIGLGVSLGLLFSYQLVTYIAKSVPGLTYDVPWGLVVMIALAAYLASMIMTYLPAQQASRIYPAEALRYE